MARFTSSTFGKISGKHGDAVAAVRKDGTCILKVYRVASNPNTYGQKNQRAKFGFVMKELNCMRSIFTHTYGGQYGINKAVSQSIKQAVMGEFPDFTLDFSNVNISEKSLSVAIKFELSKTNLQTISITWVSDYSHQNLKTANVSFVLLQPELRQVIWKQNIVSFDSEFAELTIPSVWEVEKLHIWAYLSPTDKNSTIQGLYIGSIE